MTKFNAKDAVEPLDYDFTPYSDAKGTVAEPSDEQVATFYGALAAQLQESLPPERMEGIDVTDPYDVSKLFLTLTGDEYKAMYDRLLELHVAVCSGAPSRDDLEALPYRLRRAWYGMVQGWLRPEASTPDTNG